MTNKLYDLGDELTIYAKRIGPEWTLDSEGVAVVPNEDGNMSPSPPGAESMEYFLEVSIAKEVAEVWVEYRTQSGRATSPEEICKAVIYYADNDAYLFDD